MVYGMLGGIGSLPGLVRGGISQLDTPVSDDSRLVTFTVKPGQSAIDVGEALQAAGLIRSPLTFRAAVESRGVGAKIESGDYQLSPSMTTAEIVAVLSQGREPQRHPGDHPRRLARRAGRPEGRGGRRRAGGRGAGAGAGGRGSRPAAQRAAAGRRIAGRVPVPGNVRGREGCDARARWWR